jgi:hypothetical protein
MQRVPDFQAPNIRRRLATWAAASILAALLAGGCTSSSPAGSASDAPADSATEPATEPALALTETAVDAVDDALEPMIQSREDRFELGTPKALPEVVPPEDDNPVIGEVPLEILDAIVTDLTESEGLSKDGILVTRAESVLWPDGSLGCPKPDEMYTQAEVEGYWVVLEAEGQVFDYRVNKSGYFFPCEGPGLVPPKSATPAM